ncbi:phage tail protein [Schaedlerella arabinosiphila]|uniref:phage tail protein n=1 Tax=Schaedlerella arabinosiphila TaxID=2044587 RepID=UPI002557E279|nr:phage tail protein [Schaedlerella arabinosiphila]
MINLYDGELIDMLPSQMSTEIQQRCISYALKKGIRLVIERADMTRTIAVIDRLPEQILDILAVEMRTPYYREEMDIEVKRRIIKRTLMWHLTAGTPGAVEELVAAVFGEGEVKEWFEYGGEPYRFKIVTNALLTEDMNAYFSEMIQIVKNIRSHIEVIEIHRTVDQELYAGVCQCHPQYKPAAIIDGYCVGREVSQTIFAGMLNGQISYPEPIIELGIEREEESKCYSHLTGQL